MASEMNILEEKLNNEININSNDNIISDEEMKMIIP